MVLRNVYSRLLDNARFFQNFQIVSGRVLESIDPLLEELECGKEYGVDRGGPSHRHAQSAVHVPSEELDFGNRYSLTL